MSCPEQRSGHVRAEGSLESVSCLLISRKEMDPGVSQSRPRGVKALPILGILRGPGCCPGQAGQDKDAWIPQGSSGSLAQVIRWTDRGSGWLHGG